jgi:hypothetical protein
VFDITISLQPLEPRMSPSALFAPALIAAQAASPAPVSVSYDDPQPDPEPSPGPYPGDNPPVEYPEFPPSGPVGPGVFAASSL